MRKSLCRNRGKELAGRREQVNFAAKTKTIKRMKTIKQLSMMVVMGRKAKEPVGMTSSFDKL